MKIQSTNYCPTFNAKFKNNKAFQEVVQHAVDNNCLGTLDSALNTLKKADDCTFIITHGRDGKGIIYSTIINGKRSVSNRIKESISPAEASYNGILALSRFDREYKSLVGTSQPKQNISKESIIKEYTVS